MPYLLNCWYLAAWRDELPPGTHLARTIAEKPLLLFSDQEGNVSTLLDRCPHRFAPLSKGVMADDRVTCGYHGIAFDRKGRCVDNPHGPIVPALRVPFFPTTLWQRGVWVWLGDADRADTSLLPDLSLISSLPETAQSVGYEAVAANYLLCVDNILDTTHADYVHPDSLGGGSTTRAEQTVVEEQGQILVSRLGQNDMAPSAMAALMPELAHEKADVHFVTRWTAPGVMVLNAGTVQTSNPDGPSVETWGIHIMTPQDSRNTHYFYWNGRNMKQEAEVNEIVKRVLKRAFAEEDKPMLEAQQARIGDAEFEAMRPVLLRSDEASARARRLLQRRIAEEMAAAGA